MPRRFDPVLGVSLAVPSVPPPEPLQEPPRAPTTPRGRMQGPFTRFLDLAHAYNVNYAHRDGDPPRQLAATLTRGGDLPLPGEDEGDGSAPCAFCRAAERRRRREAYTPPGADRRAGQRDGSAASSWRCECALRAKKTRPATAPAARPVVHARPASAPKWAQTTPAAAQRRPATAATTRARGALCEAERPLSPFSPQARRRSARSAAERPKSAKERAALVVAPRPRPRSATPRAVSASRPSSAPRVRVRPQSAGPKPMRERTQERELVSPRATADEEAAAELRAFERRLVGLRYHVEWTATRKDGLGMTFVSDA